MIDCTPPKRIYSQYQNSPKLTEWMNITHIVGDPLCVAANVVINSYDIDSNVDAQLDVIGSIVVRSRGFINQIILPVYQFGNEDNQCGDESIQCSVESVNSDNQLSDDYYRVMLKSKIQKNNNDTTLDGIYEAFNVLTGNTGSIRVVDPEDMTFGIEFSGVLDGVVRELLLTEDILPRPQGVKYRGVLEVNDIVECGNDMLQCGDETAECVGYIGAF